MLRGRGERLELTCSATSSVWFRREGGDEGGDETKASKGAEAGKAGAGNCVWRQPDLGSEEAGVGKVSSGGLELEGVGSGDDGQEGRGVVVLRGGS